MAIVGPTGRTVLLSHRCYRCYRCRVCGAEVPAWIPAARAPDGALLLGHLSQHHPTEVGAYMARMHTSEDIAPVATEAYEVMEAEAEES